FLTLLKEIMLVGQRAIFFSTLITTDLDKIADYIAFIQDGELILNQSVHEISENYGLVKVGLDLLERETEEAFMHVQLQATGFGALTNDIATVKSIFGESVVIDEASLEDIMYYLKGRIVHG